MLPGISWNSCPLNLLFIPSHQAKIIIVKRLIQGRNNVTRVRVEPISFNQGHRKNDAFNHLATLPTLGLNIDDKLNFKKHIKIVEQKVAWAVGILAKSKHYLSQDIQLQLYHASIECHLIYAIPVWGSTFQTYFDKLTTCTNNNYS